jgi:hypothetical protein
METTPWQLSGDHFETCSCDCIRSCMRFRLASQPMTGYCNAARLFPLNHWRDGQLQG